MVNSKKYFDKRFRCSSFKAGLSAEAGYHWSSDDCESLSYQLLSHEGQQNTLKTLKMTTLVATAAYYHRDMHKSCYKSY